LILDEPTTGLDPLMQEKFFDLLKEENRKGMTVFFSSHVLSEVQLLCKRVAIIREGKIIKVEEIEALRKKQLKRVHVEFAEATDEAMIQIPGMVNPEYSGGGTLSFVYHDDLNRLIAFLSERKVRNLTIEEPSLEEIFLHYYR
jgi:ABC-2 type transport system ATP-binding protein